MQSHNRALREATRLVGCGDGRKLNVVIVIIIVIIIIIIIIADNNLTRRSCGVGVAGVN